MTSRLKHKLEIENINVKSKYLNESFVQIGTPLPALAENKKDKLEYVPEWNQEVWVRDEQGRRRFHGAFTGGFSAGYYNTVGSKEGWAPSTFKSSRSNRANKTQRVEDFMDEEDLAGMREDRSLTNTETFRSDRLGSTKAEFDGRAASSGASAFDSLIAPAKSSIGEKLLQKQGWRPGQGIGPRISLKRLRRQEQKHRKNATSGQDGGMEVDEDFGGDEAAKHTFAPRDIKLLVFAPKEDQQGLGFVPGMGTGLSRAPATVLRANHVQVDDEDDPYGPDDAGPSRSNRHYAFDDLEDDSVTIGAPSTAVGGAGLQRPSSISASADIDTSRYHDGRPVLPGFELDPLGAPADKWFEVPEIPPDWHPRPARVWGTTRKFDEAPGQMTEAAPAAIRGAPGQPLSIQQRGNAFGETPRAPPQLPPFPPSGMAPSSAGDSASLPPLPPFPPNHAPSLTSSAKSVFEFMSEKDRERLQSFIAASKAANAVSSSQADTANAPIQSSFMGETPTEVVIPPLSPRTAGAALRGFVPYGDDLGKQERYKSYLSSQTYSSSTPNPTLRKGTVEEINNELQDFASSARIFRPMSYAMSSRFTTGSASLAVSDMQQPQAGLHMYDAAKAASAEAAKQPKAEVENAKPLTPREQAAKDGRYGKATRTERPFYPTKMVCRRFGVKDPHPEGEPKGIEIGGNAAGATGSLDGMPLPSNDASWQSAFVHQSTPTAFGSTSKHGLGGGTPIEGQLGSGGAGGPEEDEVERVPKTLADVGMPGDANQGRDTLTYTKPSIDIFKAIFANDNSDDSDEEAAREGKDGEDDDVPASVLIERQNAKRAAERKRKLDVEREKREQSKKEEGPADLATFKPVFQRKLQPEVAEKVEDRADEPAEGDGSKIKKKRKKGDKDKRKGVLSFHVDEDEGGGGEWVEKKVKIQPAAAIKASSTPADGATGTMAAPTHAADGNDHPHNGNGANGVNGSGDRSGDGPRKEKSPPPSFSSFKAPAGRKSAADFM